MNTIEALAGAIDMLQHISRGKSYKTGEYFDRLMSYEAVLQSYVHPDAIDAIRVARGPVIPETWAGDNFHKFP